MPDTFQKCDVYNPRNADEIPCAGKVFKYLITGDYVKYGPTELLVCGVHRPAFEMRDLSMFSLEKGEPKEVGLIAEGNPRPEAL